MKNFDSMFTKAVKSILIEKTDAKPNSVDDRGTGNKKQVPLDSASKMILWNPGPGRWSDAIRGLKKDADVPYSQVINSSSAVGTRSKSLMARLNILKPSDSKNDIASANQILLQAFQSPLMSALYATPVVGKNSIVVPIKLSTQDKDIVSGEGVSARNAAVYIHLTLIGAYNAGMLKIQNRLMIENVSKNDTTIVIRSSGL
jgi:hypothetical protein